MSTAPLAPTPAPSNPPFEANAWRNELQARVRDHRGRSSRWPPEEVGGAPFPESGSVAARVAERWREAPSYNDLLRASAHAAEQAAAAAEAAAEAARLTSQAAQSAAERDVFADPFFSDAVPRHANPAPEDAGGAGPWWADEPPAPFAVEHHAPLPARVAAPLRSPLPPPRFADSFAEATAPAAQGLAAKLIEFPSELVAARKQRPRLAEGPLLSPEGETLLRVDEAPGGAGHSMDSAFSGGRFAAAFSSEPFGLDAARRRAGFSAGDELAWGAIHLGEHPAPLPAEEAPEPETSAESAFAGLAPISDRLLAALVDGSVVGGVFLLSTKVFASTAAHAPLGKGALALAALALALGAAFYGWLFLSFGGGSTPGMRCARIALCTFDNENPSRRKLQARVPATALALLPLGLGAIWALLDEDRLGWHDRMTRTYQRSYR